MNRPGSNVADVLIASAILVAVALAAGGCDRMAPPYPGSSREPMWDVPLRTVDAAIARRDVSAALGDRDVSVQCLLTAERMLVERSDDVDATRRVDASRAWIAEKLRRTETGADQAANSAR